MEQQRTRRYKSQYLTTLEFSEKTKKDNAWNTAAITPGTRFMDRLSNDIAKEFVGKELAYGVNQIVVSGSVEPGEGEHKMYAHLRHYASERKHADIYDNVAIYGLDSDLIMLSIFHTTYCNNIYIFREAPVFGDTATAHSFNKKPANSSDNKLPLFLNINKLMHSICMEMDCVKTIKESRKMNGKQYDKHRVFDYVFMCFFLGNDFMPHFPSLNIRTHGIQVLLDTYRIVLAKENRYLLTKNGEHIIWKHVNLLIKELAKNEHTLLLQEYETRDKWDKRQWPDTTPKEKEDLFNNVPVIYRTEEKYICPQEPHWETRYYSALFHQERNQVFVKSVSINYLEGLEWVYRYYTRGCPDWRWKYNYHYPPLLMDLIKYVPHHETVFITPNASQPFSPYVQLSYVLPPAQFGLLPGEISGILNEKYKHLYSEKMDFQWAFCRYFWESHNVNNQIPIEVLENMEREFLGIVRT